MQNKSQLIIYQTEAGETKIDVRFQDETVWLSQQLMAELFQTTVPNINMHIKNIFDEGELSKNATIKDFLIVQKEGERQVRRKVDYYDELLAIFKKILWMETVVPYGIEKNWIFSKKTLTKINEMVKCLLDRKHQ